MTYKFVFIHRYPKDIKNKIQKVLDDHEKAGWKVISHASAGKYGSRISIVFWRESGESKTNG